MLGVNQIDLRELPERGEVRYQRPELEPFDVAVVEIYVPDSSAGENGEGYKEGNSRNQPDSTIDRDPLTFDVLTNGGEQSETHFLVKYIKNILISASSQQFRVSLDDLHDSDRRWAGPDIHRLSLLCCPHFPQSPRIKVGHLLCCSKDMLQLVDQHIDTDVETGSYTLVQHLLEAFLFLRGRIEEVVAVCQSCSYQLLLVENIDHLLNQITNIDELEKGDQRGNAVGCVDYFARVVFPQVLDGLVEASSDVSGAKDLEERNKDSLALLTTDEQLVACNENISEKNIRFLSSPSSDFCKHRSTFQTLLRHVHELQCHIETE